MSKASNIELPAIPLDNGGGQRGGPSWGTRIVAGVAALGIVYGGVTLYNQHRNQIPERANPAHLADPGDVGQFDTADRQATFPPLADAEPTYIHALGSCALPDTGPTAVPVIDAELTQVPAGNSLRWTVTGDGPPRSGTVTADPDGFADLTIPASAGRSVALQVVQAGHTVSLPVLLPTRCNQLPND